MTLGLIALVLVALLVLFVWQGQKPVIHRGVSDAELPRYFDVLLQRGVSGGQMFVRIEGTGSAVLPFTKYASGVANGIRLTLPLTTGAEAFYESATAAVRAGGFPVRIEEPPDDRSQQWAVVDVGSDLDEASRLVKVVLQARSPGEKAVDIWFKRVGPGTVRSHRDA